MAAYITEIFKWYRLDINVKENSAKTKKSYEWAISASSGGDAQMLDPISDTLITYFERVDPNGMQSKEYNNIIIYYKRIT